MTKKQIIEKILIIEKKVYQTPPTVLNILEIGLNKMTKKELLKKEYAYLIFDV